MVSRLAYAALVVGAAFVACSPSNGSLGDTCDNHGDCGSDLQCVASVCVARCHRAPECGDGYACNRDGICTLADGQSGDRCKSEVDCAPGLSCQLDMTIGDDGHLVASCAASVVGRPAGSRCFSDVDCSNGTCALGHCVDLCTETPDCSSGTQCMTIPRIEARGVPFMGCLPSHGSLVWTIPVLSPTQEILLPIPSAARSAQLTMTIDDVAQKVGAQTIVSPGGTVIYDKPCDPQNPVTPMENCTERDAADMYYDEHQKVRHLPLAGQSTLEIPIGVPPNEQLLVPGPYRIKVSSFRSNGTAGSAIPRLTAVAKLDSSVTLDLHFYFLDLDDHPCRAAFAGGTLDAATANVEPYFQSDYLGELRTIFAGGGIVLGTSTFEDVTDHPDLDGLSIEAAGSLLSLGSHAEGINVFFVRTLSPVGLQAFAPNPGPAQQPNTRQSGIIVSADTLCYRSWPQLARLTAHELARYMGLYHNVELEHTQAPDEYPSWLDQIPDTDGAVSNLMFFSELGGIELTAGQREILTKSAVLR
ncbi:MAG: hypothetical protein AB7O24_03385 [Kofleriaceae bacterium]